MEPMEPGHCLGGGTGGAGAFSPMPPYTPYPGGNPIGGAPGWAAATKGGRTKAPGFVNNACVGKIMFFEVSDGWCERQLGGSEFARAVRSNRRKCPGSGPRRTCCVSMLPPSPYCPPACVVFGAAATSFDSAICGKKRGEKVSCCWAHKRKERRVALGATVRPAVDVKTPRTLFLGAHRAFFVSVPVIVSFACVLRPACLLKDAPLAGKSQRKKPEPGFSSKAPGPRPLGFTGPPYEPRGGYRSLLGRVEN